MMESRDLSVCRGSLQMSIPSMTIFPGGEQTGMTWLSYSDIKYVQQQFTKSENQEN